MPTVGTVAGVTLVIWPFDHLPPHVHAYDGTPNTPSARRSRFEIATGNLIDRPSPDSLSTTKARRVQEWITEHRDELLDRWQSLQP